MDLALMPSQEVRDILAMVIPNDDVCEGDPRIYNEIYKAAIAHVHMQYLDKPPVERPQITFQRIDTLVTRDPQKIDDWPMVHDCDSCREGYNLVRSALQENPRHLGAMANIYYTETTP
jgi:hypothetical protein